MTILKNIFITLLAVLFIYNCANKPQADFIVSELAPKLEPDYSELIIPPNISPMNFIIKENGSSFFVRFSSENGTEIEVSSRSGKIQIPEKKWRKMLESNAGDRRAHV